MLVLLDRLRLVLIPLPYLRLFVVVVELDQVCLLDLHSRVLLLVNDLRLLVVLARWQLLHRVEADLLLGAFSNHHHFALLLLPLHLLFPTHDLVLVDLLQHLRLLLLLFHLKVREECLALHVSLAVAAIETRESEGVGLLVVRIHECVLLTPFTVLFEFLFHLLLTLLLLFTLVELVHLEYLPLLHVL